MVFCQHKANSEIVPRSVPSDLIVCLTGHRKPKENW